MFSGMARPLRKLVLILGIVLSLLPASAVFAFGPVTHQQWACAVLGEPAEVCLSTPRGRSFALGSSAPDALRDGLAHGEIFHTLYYAQLQYDLALSWRSTSPGFDAVAFSRGYAAHLAEDLVGHHAGGLLRHPEGHEFEAALDTLMLLEHPDLRLQKFSEFEPGVLEFLTAAAARLADAEHSAELAELRAPQISNALAKFDRFLSVEDVVLKINIVYRRELIALDPYGASDWSQTWEDVHRSRACALRAAVRAEWALRRDVGAPKRITPDVEAFVDSLFDEGACSPHR